MMADAPNTHMLTYRYRVKDKHASQLNAMARSVNFVWNYCNDAQKHALKWGRRWPSAFDLHRVTAGTSVELGIPSHSIGATCTQYARSRQQFGRPFLRYRGKRSLGWVPFRAESLSFSPKGFRFSRRPISVWLSRQLPADAKILDGGSFSQDARGRWYLNVVVRVPVIAAREPERRVGIDLGLKALATLSTGEKIEAPRLYRASERRLAVAQRAGHRARAKTIQDKIANQRRDALHKASIDIVRKFDVIAVGDVSASKLKKTRMAKSVSDAGWSTFRNMLRYKAIAHGATYLEVDEAFSTRACSECGSISGPGGYVGLVIREWQCAHCDAVHDRDVNAAKFILRAKPGTLSGEPVQRLAA